MEASKTWKDYFDFSETVNGTPIYYAGIKGPIALCLHGAGDSSMTFACMAKSLKVYAQVIAFDFKGHGMSEHNEISYHIDKLIEEAENIVAYLYSKQPKTNIVMVGHSVGGSVATRFVEKMVNHSTEYKYAPNVKRIMMMRVICD